MTQEEQAILIIKGLITELPAADAEAVHELAEHIRQVCKAAGPTVGNLALALVGVEAQAANAT